MATKMFCLKDDEINIQIVGKTPLSESFRDAANNEWSIP